MSSVTVWKPGQGPLPAVPGKGQGRPTKYLRRNRGHAPEYWLSTLPAETELKDLVHMAKHRWIIERDYQELKPELGLGHYEGRGWRGFHHHAALCRRHMSRRNLRPEPANIFPFCFTKDRYIKAFDPAVLEAMQRMQATVDVLEKSPAVVQQMN